MKASTINPTVSVILPTYNRAYCLPSAIESVLSQTYPYFELIIIDNSSLDSTSSLVHEYQARDSRISFYTIVNNGLISVSRNYGISMSRGDLIAFIDSDDYWYPDKLSLSVQAMSQNISLLYHDMEIISIKDSSPCPQHLGHTSSPEGITFLKLLRSGNSICNSSVVVRRSSLEVLNGISEDPSLVGAEDYHTWLKLLQSGSNSLKLPWTLGRITFRDDAMTSSLRDYRYTQSLLATFALDLNNTVPAWAIIKLLTYQLMHPHLLMDLKLWSKYLRNQGTVIKSLRLLIMLLIFGLRIALKLSLSALKVPKS